MTYNTEEKIMNTALNIFAAKGYIGAKTKFIAEESGFSEMTLFRKFKTKKNLYDRVMENSQRKLLTQFQSLFKEVQFKNSREFLEYLIKNINFLIENNFEYIVISSHEGPQQSKSGDINSFILKELGGYIKRQNIFRDSDVDFEIFTFNLFTFMFFLISDRKHGKLFNNHEEVIDKFVSYSVRCFGS